MLAGLVARLLDGTNDAVHIYVVTVVLQLSSHKQRRQQAASYADGKADRTHQGLDAMAADLPDRKE